MAKKKQEYSTENVDEMVERLKKSYENADRTEGEDTDPSADDEAFAKMLVEMFGNQGKSRPSAAKKSTDVYSAEDFMPEDEDDAKDLAQETEEDFEEEVEEDFEEEVEEDFEEDFEEEVEEDFEEETEQDFEEEVEEDFEEDLDEEIDQEYEQDAEQLAEQIRTQAQEKIMEQFRQEQAEVATKIEPESEEIPERELPWFEDDEFDEEDAREIAEYEALVAEDELEAALDDSDEDDEYIEEDFDEEEILEEELEEDFDEEEILEEELEEDFDEEEILEEELEEDFDEEEILEEELEEDFDEEEILEEELEEDFDEEEILEEELEEDFDEEEILEEELGENFDEEEFIDQELAEDDAVIDEPETEEPIAAQEQEEQPEPEEDYVDMLLDSLEEWKQSVQAVKAQMRAEHSAEIPTKPESFKQADAPATSDAPNRSAEPAPVPAQDEIMADPLTETAPEYPAHDPMQGRVAKHDEALAEGFHERVEFDEKDIHMMAALGYEQEVKGKVGSARVRSASQVQKHKHLGKGTDNALCFAYRGKEYMDAADEEEIKQNYRKEKPWVITRLAVCVAMLFSLIALDNAYLIGYLQNGKVPAIITSPLYPLIAALAIMVVAAVSWRRLWEGLRSMFTHSHSLYSVPAVMLGASLIYDIVLIFLTGEQYMMFNSMAALALVLCTVADVLDLYSQERNFRVVRSGKPRYGIEKIADVSAQSRLPLRKGEEPHKVQAGAYRVRKMGLLAGYFRRTGANAERGAALSIVYGVLLVCAVAAASATYIVTGQTMGALSAFMVCLNGAMPLSMLLFGAIPSFVAGKTLMQNGCAVIGTDALDQYKDVKALMFDAGQMFTAYGSSQITVRGDSDIGTYMEKTRTLLRALGGTLADIAGDEQEEPQTPVKIEIMSVAENGMTLYMDGITCIMMGDYDYLTARGVRLPRRDMEKNYKKRNDSAVTYIAFDGVFRVGYSVDLELRREFLTRAKQLQAEGIDPVIVSYDPCINQETLYVRAKDSGITVERQREYEGNVDEMLLDCGVVATRAPEDVLLPLLACRKLRFVRTVGMIWRFAYLVLTTALVVLLSVLGYIWYVWPLLLLLYQALWLLIIPIVCTGLLGDLRKTKN